MRFVIYSAAATLVMGVGMGALGDDWDRREWGAAGQRPGAGYWNGYFDHTGSAYGGPAPGYYGGRSGIDVYVGPRYGWGHRHHGYGFEGHAPYPPYGWGGQVVPFGRDWDDDDDGWDDYREHLKEQRERAIERRDELRKRQWKAQRKWHDRHRDWDDDDDD